MGSFKQAILFKIKDSKALGKLLKPVVKLWKRNLERQVVRHPLRRINEQHRIYYGKSVDLENPQTLYEKISLMEFCSDTRLMTRCTDKVAVRDYISQLGLGEYLNPVYKIFETLPSIAELDAATPMQCVVKTSHSGGGEAVFVIESKQPDTIAKIYPRLVEAFNDDYGLRTGQPHYRGIKPMIIIEKLIVNTKSPGTPPDDYKIFCINGSPVIINAIGERNIHAHTMLDEYFDLEWNPLGKNTVNNPRKVAKPQKLDEMINVARELAAPFPFVRVDFYESDGKIIFGELTFTPGFDTFIGDYGEKVMKLGERLDISRVQKIRDIDPDWF